MYKTILDASTSTCQVPVVEIFGKQLTPNHPHAEFVFSVACGPYIFNELQARRDNNGSLRITFPTARVQAPINGSRTIPAVFFRTHSDRVRFNTAVLNALASSNTEGA